IGGSVYRRRTGDVCRGASGADGAARRVAVKSARLIWWVLAAGLGGGLTLGLVMRLAFAYLQPALIRRQPNLEWDAQHYQRIAHNLVEGHGDSLDGVTPNTEWAPVAPFLIAGVYALGGGDLAARVVFALVGTLTIWLTYVLAPES